MWQFVGGIALCEAAGAIAGFATSASVQTWYRTLEKPSWTPPDWVFSPVWITLYAMMGAALAFLWAQPAGSQTRTWALRWFWAQLGLNVAWSFAFFGWRSPGWGYIVIVALWCAILALLWTSSRVARPATWLLVPYFLWVTFASALNFSILSINVIKPRVERMDADPRNQDDYYRVRGRRAGTSPQSTPRTTPQPPTVPDPKIGE